MSKPKHLYVIDEDCHLHSDNDECLCIQQGDLITGHGPDHCVYLSRANLAKLRDAINDFLKED